MTKNTKIIIGAAAGLILIGGFVVVLAAVVGIFYLAAQTDATGTNTNKSADKTTVKTANKLYKQADADALVEFHEWGSQTKFSRARREKFEAFLNRDFRKDAVKAQQDTDKTIEAAKSIRAAKEDAREFARIVLVAASVEEYRKKPDDPYSQFMLAIYEKREDDSPAVPSDAPDKADDFTVEKATYTKNSMRGELIGRWHRSEGDSNIDSTGKTRYKSGADYTFEFAADGTIRYSMESDVLSIMQCEIKESKRANGTANASGDSMTISFGKTAHTKSNSCESSENVNETLPAETTKFNYELKTEYETTRLCIEEKDGEKCYDRAD